ncbi:porin [Tropicimonas sp. IMCC34043]|uniref:porin n=1 Tax=Tropicimonas sp. IMCC34043 TaxID=2248760 RepID=UPI000E2509AA|nr:porin [Tropicimonas sp. IMCC34043]
MKKLLLASTALVAFAGAAAAEISISGSAKMGLVGASAKSKYDVTDGDTGVKTKYNSTYTSPAQFFQDVDVTFTMSGETDGGLAFGTSVDLDEAVKLDKELSNQGVAIFVSGDFGTVTMGDTDGALAAVLWSGDELSNTPGSLNDADTTTLGFNDTWLDGSGDGQVLRYDYTYDAFQFSMSLEQQPTGDNGEVLDGDDDIIWAVGVGYTYTFGGGNAIFGLGYQQAGDGAIEFETTDADLLNLGDDIFIGGGDTTVWGLTAAVQLDNGLTTGVTYSQYDFKDYDVNIDYWAFGIGYVYDAFQVGVNYGAFIGDDDADVTLQGWGIAAAYDLGGGLDIAAGYGWSSIDGTLYTDYNDDGVTDKVKTNDVTAENWSFGLRMAF